MPWTSAALTPPPVVVYWITHLQLCYWISHRAYFPPRPVCGTSMMYMPHSQSNSINFNLTKLALCIYTLRKTNHITERSTSFEDPL